MQQRTAKIRIEVNSFSGNNLFITLILSLQLSFKELIKTYLGVFLLRHKKMKQLLNNIFANGRGFMQVGN